MGKEVALGKQNVRAACPKDKLEFKFFFSNTGPALSSQEFPFALLTSQARKSLKLTGAITKCHLQCSMGMIDPKSSPVLLDISESQLPAPGPVSVPRTPPVPVSFSTCVPSPWCRDPAVVAVPAC